MNPQPNNQRAIVLYDGDCAFCRKSVSLLKMLDWLNRLQFETCRDPQAWPETAPGITLDQEKMIEAMHLVNAKRDAVYVGFEAFRRISWMLPLLLLAAPLLYLPGVLPIGHRAYRWVARNRFKLIPCENGACAVPMRGQSQRSTAQNPDLKHSQLPVKTD